MRCGTSSRRHRHRPQRLLCRDQSARESLPCSGDMELWLTTLAVVSCTVGLSSAIRDLSVCEEPTESCGPLPPAPPNSYIMKYEWIDLIRNQTSWIEEYFDAKNLRAKILGVMRGDEYVNIYDYFSETVTSYSSGRPGAKMTRDPRSQTSCEIAEMSNFNNQQLPFGYKYRSTRPRGSRMDSSYEALRFGGPYRARYVGPMTNEVTRNLPTNLFEGCAYDEDDEATYRMRYYWSANASFAFPNGEIDVPVRIEQYGTLSDPDGSSAEYWNTIKNVAWYQGNPEFSDEDFEVPRPVYCTNNANERKPPEPPITFSFRLEDVSFTLDETGSNVGALTSTSYKEIWYDGLRQLARVDIIPSEEEKSWPLITDSGSLDAMLSIVLDYEAEAAFVTHPSSGECVVRKLGRDFFLSNPNSSLGVEMLDRKAIFGFTVNHRFQGRYKIRGIEVETWTAVTKEAEESLNEQRSSRHEISFMTDAQAERSGELDLKFVPVQESIYDDIYKANEKLMPVFRQHVRMKNYFNFSPDQPRLSVFRAPGCIPRHEAKSFMLSLDEKNPKTIKGNKEALSDALRESLKDCGEIDTVLRIEVLQVYFDKRSKNVKALFEILGPLTELQQERVVTIEEAAQNINERIKNGSFLVTATLVDADGNKQIYSFKALEDSFVEVRWPKQASSPYRQPQKAFADINKEKENSATSQYAGYSPGVFAAIAVVFTLAGIVCGIFAMRIYLARKGPEGLIQNEELPIELQ
ncbi:uncharacterized protein LOC144178438 [Haemaphysalis longicornis]